MLQALKKLTSLILATTITVSTSQALAVEDTDENSRDRAGAAIAENPLEEARISLGRAFDEYSNGDTDSARRYLGQATESLSKAAKASNTEKAKQEAHELAQEIDEFSQKLDTEADGQESDLSRYWHRVTSIIKRETDQLIHGYTELYNIDITMRHLLDAKMHFFNAEHDLFSSHDVEEAIDELDKTLIYLDKASQDAKPPIKGKIDSLSEDVKLLRDNTKISKIAWRDENLIHELDEVLNKLEGIEGDFSPVVQMHLKQIKADIHTLRADVARYTLQDQYDSIMKKFRNTINELSTQSSE